MKLPCPSSGAETLAASISSKDHHPPDLNMAVDREFIVVGSGRISGSIEVNCVDARRAVLVHERSSLAPQQIKHLQGHMARLSDLERNRRFRIEGVRVVLIEARPYGVGSPLPPVDTYNIASKGLDSKPGLFKKGNWIRVLSDGGRTKAEPSVDPALKEYEGKVTAPSVDAILVTG